MDAPRYLDFLVLAAAGLLAVVSARDYAGCWNDRSRLATVECLVDHHTLRIDDSVFLPETGDKLFIAGHYYSDKSPVPGLLLASVYQAWQWMTGATARERPEVFCYFLTLASSGLAYVVAVWCVYRLGRPLRLTPSLRLGLTGSFALSTVALTYARHVNNHVLLLGVAAALFLCMANVCERCGVSPPVRSLFVIGSLAGLGYTIDLGAGPVLLLLLSAWVAYRWRRLSAVVAFGVAALPWLLAHHGVNYAVGGTFKPANAVPDYFLWPGSTFNPQNLTGGLHHTPGHFLGYAAGLLFDKRGFFLHNLPLLLLLSGAVVLLRLRPGEWPELIIGALWCGGTWFAYALTSNNYSGQCCSIRWFVPLLAPAYYGLAVFLREAPAYRRDFFVLSVWGGVLGGFMWQAGPWADRPMPYLWFWVLLAAALVNWGLCRAQELTQRRKGAVGRGQETMPQLEGFASWRKAS